MQCLVLQKQNKTREPENNEVKLLRKGGQARLIANLNKIGERTMWIYEEQTFETNRVANAKTLGMFQPNIAAVRRGMLGGFDEQQGGCYN